MDNLCYFLGFYTKMGRKQAKYGLRFSLDFYIYIYVASCGDTSPVFRYNNMAVH